MYAVIKTGGKQYKVAAGNLIAVEKLAGRAGDAVAFEDVLIVGGDKEPVIGSPLVAGAAVAGEIVDQKRAGKILVFKKRRRQNSKRSRGHRQEQTLVRITEILTDGKKPATAKKAKAAPAAEAVAAAPAETAAPAPAAEAAPEPKAAPEETAKPKTAPKAAEAKASTTAKPRAPSKKAESAEAEEADKAKPVRKPRTKSAKTDKE